MKRNKRSQGIISHYSSPMTKPMAPAATARAAIASPVSAAAPPVVTFVGQSMDDVLMVNFVEVIVIVEFVVMLAVLVTVELETDIELVAGGIVVAELPAVGGIIEGSAEDVEGGMVRAKPALVPQ